MGGKHRLGVQDGPGRGGKGRREARGDRLRVGSWNIGTLQGKFVEFVKILKKRRIILCVFKRLSG